jgi:thiol-disulfide isomerase/thioredoxin
MVRSMIRRRLLIAAVLGCAGAGRVMAQPSGYEWRPWPRGKRMPPLALEHLDGSPWRLADRRGRVLLANFWATWCEPCRAEMPSLVRLARERADQGLAVVAINYREAVPVIERFVERQGLDGLTVLRDREGAAAAAWTPRIFPSTVVFDRRGRPTGVLVGELDWQGREAQALIDPLLAEPAPRSARLSLPAQSFEGVIT